MSMYFRGRSRVRIKRENSAMGGTSDEARSSKASLNWIDVDS